MSDDAGGSGRYPDTDRGEGFAALLAARRAGGPTILMGIVNVTPDSFSDGGRFATTEAAVEQGRRLAAEGAAILDVGGESTRPGAEPVAAEEEMRRVLPAVAALAQEGEEAGGALISIDTVKAAVAAAALEAGAHIVNDVRGLQGDPAMAMTAARFGAGVIAMHNPALTGSGKPINGDPVAACLGFFERSLAIARRAGIADDRIAFDPGLGFGKSGEQNMALIARLPELSALGFPILIGASRKSFIGRITGREMPARLPGSLAAATAAALNGAAILRVHDAAAHRDAVRVAQAILQASAAGGRAAP